MTEARAIPMPPEEGSIGYTIGIALLHAEELGELGAGEFLRVLDLVLASLESHGIDHRAKGRYD